MIGGASFLFAQTAPPAPATPTTRPSPPPKPAAQTQPAATGPATPPATFVKHPPRTAIEFTPVSHVEKRGDGPINMVLIPGLGCDWSVFGEFMERNKSRYTMYALTLPGFGESNPPPEITDEEFGLWLENAFQAVWTFIRESNLEQTVIVGHSLGGHIALRIGCERANRIRAIVSIDGGPASPAIAPTVTLENRILAAQKMGFELKSMTKEQWAAEQRSAISRMVTDPKRAKEIADMCLQVPVATTVQYMMELMAADIRLSLPKLKFPTLVMATAATEDSVMNETVRRIWTGLTKNIPNCKLAFYENTRHFIMDDRPADLDKAIEDFLAGREVKGYTMPPQPGAANEKPAK